MHAALIDDEVELPSENGDSYNEELFEVNLQLYNN